MRLVALAATLLALAGLTAGPASATTADPTPSFADGHGITVTAEHQVDARRIDLTVTSTAVAGAQNVHILLPTAYEPAKRYPVLWPPVGADAIFGPPLIGFDGGWLAGSPAQNVAPLRGMGLAIYTGSGSIADPASQIVERNVRDTAWVMHRSLDAAGIPHTFDDYGDGHTTGPGHCDGNHDFGCWRNGLVDVLPRILAVVRHP